MDGWLVLVAILSLLTPLAFVGVGLWVSRDTPEKRAMRRQVAKSDPLPKGLKHVARYIRSFYWNRNFDVIPVRGSISYMASRIEFAVAPDIDTKKVKRTQGDLEHYLRAHNIDLAPESLIIEISGIMSVTYTHSAKSPVLLSKIFRKEKPLQGSFILGMDIMGNIIRLPMNTNSYPHCIVIGATGSGKSVMGLVIAANALYMGWKLWVFNPKSPPVNRDTYGLWQLKGAENVTYIENYDDMAYAANEIVTGMNKISEPTLVIVDEAADIISANKAIADSMGRIAQKGREYDLHLLIMVPKATKGVLFDDLLHANVGTALIGMKVNSKQLSLWSTGISDMHLDKLAGNGHCKLKTGSDIVELQAALPDNIEQITRPGGDSGYQPSEILPVTEDWFSRIPVGGDVSKDALRKFASATGGMSYNAVKQQYWLLVEQGRIETNGKFRAATKVM